MKLNLLIGIKIYLCIIIISVLQSCSLLSMMVDQEFDKISDTLDLSLKSNKLTFPVSINDKETYLFFDTGSGVPLLYDDSALNDKKPVKISKFGSINNFGNKLDFYRTPLKLKTQLFKSDNTVFAVVPDFHAINECSKREITGVFYGIYFKDKILNINFEKEKLFMLDSLKNKDYTEIESKFFKMTQILIKLKVNGNSEWFHFDTGNVLYPLLLTNRSKITDDLNPDFSLQNNRLSLIRKKNNTFYYEDVITDFGEEEVNTYAVTNDGTSKYKYNNVGILFIKNYNWIIDYKNKRVFYKKYKQGELNSIVVKKNQLNRCAVEEGKLVIIQLLNQETESSIYELNQEIISVNDTLITSENICTYLDLLNNTDWGTLDILTKS